MSTVVFLLVRRLLGRVGLGRQPDEKDVKIAVLRHQLAVLRRPVELRVGYHHADVSISMPTSASWRRNAPMS